MFDEATIFKLALQQLQAMALHWNEEGRKRWELAVANWKLNAEWARDNARPEPEKPPAPIALMTATVPEGSIEQGEIVMGLSKDKFVSDLPCELTPIAVPNKPPGVTAVGYEYGNVFSALETDTMPNGSIVRHVRKSGAPVTLRKVYHPRGTMGALFSDHNFYEVVAS